MAHVRKLIRDNIKTTITDLATTGRNVYQSRVYPISGPKLPSILLFNKAEEIEYQTIGTPRLQMRTAEFELEIYVKGVSGYDDSLDQICVEVEEALYTDLTRGGHAQDTRVTNFSADFNGDGDQPVAVATLTIEVQYQVRENNPDVSI